MPVPSTASHLQRGQAACATSVVPLKMPELLVHLGSRHLGAAQIRHHFSLHGQDACFLSFHL